MKEAQCGRDQSVLVLNGELTPPLLELERRGTKFGGKLTVCTHHSLPRCSVSGLSRGVSLAINPCAFLFVVDKLGLKTQLGVFEVNILILEIPFESRNKIV